MAKMTDDTVILNKDKERDPPLNAKEEWSDFAKTAFIAVCLALLIRSLFLEPFNIPSGSMKPTLQVGDYLFVNKPAYGYSRYSFPLGIAPIEGRAWAKEPQRGDVIVFKLPTNTSIDYIKRVIGLPGDTIQVIGGRLFINGKQVHREMTQMRRIEEMGRTVTVKEYLETLPGGTTHLIFEEGDRYPLDDTKLFKVPAGHYFVMGDNRDNSQDSRVESLVGFVPFENIVGRADFIFFSVKEGSQLLKIWEWPWNIRYERLFMDIDPVRVEGDE